MVNLNAGKDVSKQFGRFCGETIHDLIFRGKEPWNKPYEGR